jgi:phage tail-like protein
MVDELERAAYRPVAGSTVTNDAIRENIEFNIIGRREIVDSVSFTANRVDPCRNFRFRVEIDGIQQANYIECTGLGSSIEVVPYREGTDPKTVRMLSGATTFSKIKLKWGATPNMDMYNWYRSGIDGAVSRRNISIILINEAGEDEMRWNLSNAWPCAYEGPELNALTADTAYESMTLVYERMDKVM